MYYKKNVPCNGYIISFCTISLSGKPKQLNIEPKNLNTTRETENSYHRPVSPTGTLTVGLKQLLQPTGTFPPLPLSV